MSGTDGPPAPDASTLRHPRILCLHGGGTNSRIFHMQCRGLSLQLKTHFRLVFAEAPFPATAGPDVLTVYAECGPFKRWVVTVPPNDIEQQPRETWEAVERQLGDAMDADDRLGATGEWVALLGFSQGGKMAASLLLRQQYFLQRGRPEALGRIGRGPTRERGFRMGILMAARGPLVPPDPEQEGPVTSSSSSSPWLGEGEKFDYDSNRDAKRLVTIPTIHVHGLLDPGLSFHRTLLKEWCQRGTTTLIQWNGNHRLPFKTDDVKLVVDAILMTAEEEGIIIPSY